MESSAPDRHPDDGNPDDDDTAYTPDESDADESGADESGTVGRIDRRLELLVVLVMGLTAVLTAWTGYQSAKWSGVQSSSYSQAGAQRTESARASSTAGHQMSLDAAVLIAWVEAVAADDGPRADFMRDRFSRRLDPAVDAWLALDPLENPDAPATPFDMDEYVVPAELEAEALALAAESSAADARAASGHIDSYVVMTVLFATVLFFAAMSTKFPSRRNRIVVFDVSVVGLVAGVVLLLMLPIEL